MPVLTSLDRRSFLRLGLGVTVLGAVGTGCSPATPSSSKQEAGTFTIYWNAGHGYQAYKEVIDQFGKDHDLTINWQKFQWPDLTTKLTADFRSGNVPDLVEEISAGTGTQYGLAGNVLALDEFAAADKAFGFPGDFIDAAVTARQYEGKTYSIPLHLTANGLVFYNKALLSAAGFSKPPTTWDEFLEIAKATSKDKVSGTALNSDPAYSAPFYQQQRVAFSDVAAKQFMSPPDSARSALQYMQDLVFASKVSPAPVATTDYSGPQKLFSAKRAAMFVSGPWDLAPVRQGSPDIDLGLAAPLTGSVQAAAMAGAGLMIPAKAKDPKLSWELLTKLAAVKTELAATKEAGMSMPRKSWAADPAVAGDANLAIIAKALAVVTPQDAGLPASGKAAQINELYKKAYQQIIIQQAPVEATLADFRKQAGAAL
ncbi:sugar ABC transporter substrate-binding protein [Kribbella italica]|uniref:Multiple sugar transport system substrate-binding protein n=1 Tax=Kribbella italica TaxID=1540520 RepID=A0A7W9J513_9ACTN|nr:extracellular solute-binding protein [Kribbella italica]MBB5835729.1 multiple sugar transport system substrate-binding protein [Kribbella italica]